MERHVKLSRITRAGSAVAIGALALTLAACGSDNNASAGAGTGTSSANGGSASLSGELNGAGSTAQGSAQDAWRSGFQSANPNVTVNYDGIGSGGGRKQFISGASQFGGSDAYMTDDEVTQAKAGACSGGDVVEIPAYISPIVVAFNLKGVTSLNLDSATVAKIFDGKITTWDDPAIKATNAGVKLPSTKITPVHRSDDSGTTENFTEWLADTAKSAWSFPASQTFPVKGGQSGNGTSGVVQVVKAAEGTVAYIDASQAGTLGTAKIKVGSSWVAHSPAGAAAAVAASKIVPGRGAGDIAVDINRTQTDPSTYPLVLVSYDLACTTYKDAGQAAAVKAYFTYIISSAAQQAAASAAGSAPLSPSLVTKATAAVNTIQAG
jgi:phosphate transport system substrate-binding protein